MNACGEYAKKTNLRIKSVNGRERINDPSIVLNIISIKEVHNIFSQVSKVILQGQ